MQQNSRPLKIRRFQHSQKRHIPVRPKWVSVQWWFKELTQNKPEEPYPFSHSRSRYSPSLYASPGTLVRRVCIADWPMALAPLTQIRECESTIRKEIFHQYDQGQNKKMLAHSPRESMAFPHHHRYFIPRRIQTTHQTFDPGSLNTAAYHNRLMYLHPGNKSSPWTSHQSNRIPGRNLSE